MMFCDYREVHELGGLTVDEEGVLVHARPARTTVMPWNEPAQKSL